MPIGNFKLVTRINNAKAKKDAKDFEKIVDESAKKAANSGKDTAINIDVKKAEKEIQKLSKEIDEYEKKIAKLENGELGHYNTERSIEKDRLKTNLKVAGTPKQKETVRAESDAVMAQIDQKYSAVLAKADEYGKIIALNDSKIQQLKSDIEQVNSAEQKVDVNAEQLNNSVSKTRLFFEKIVSTAKRSASAIGSGIVNGLKKAVQGAKSLAKNLGSALSNKLKSAVTHIKNMGKQATSLTKSFTRAGLALIGIRGLMTGLRQIVSSALSDNEKLQNQLSTIKGVLGQALAPAINVLLQGLSQIVSFADRLYQIFTGTSLIAKYNAQQAKTTASATLDAADAAANYNAQMAGFDVANKLSDSSSSSSNSSDDDTASLFHATNINSWLQSIIDQVKEGDWYGVGETIAGGINSALAKINWSDIQTKVNTFCKNLGEAVNGFVDALDWSATGNAVGEGINTITGGINSLVDTINWDNLGTGLATGLNGIIDKIDGEGLGKTLSAKLKILTNTLYGFFNGNGENDGFNFKNFGTKIGDTVNSWFNNIEWDKVASNISSAIKGLCDTLSSAIDTINWNDGEDSITQKIKDFFSNLDWSGMLTSACAALGKALGGLGSTIIQLLKDAWNNWKSTYIDPAVEEAGGNIINGVFNGIVNWLKSVGTWIKDNILNPFIEGFKSVFDIHSPSKNEDILELGKNIIAGIFNGIDEWLKDIKTWFKKNVFDKITDAWSDFKELTISIGGKIQDSFTTLKEKWDSIKDKINTSNIKGSIQSTFNTLKTKWDSIKNKTNTSSIKGSIQSTFNTLKTKWDSIKNKTNTSTIKGSIASSFNSALNNWNSLKSKAVTVTTSLKDGITSAIQKILNSLCSMVNKVITALNKLPGITISPITPPKLAKGGIVNNPGRGTTVTVGEAGPEGVIPLNDSVLSKLGAMIGEYISGGSSGSVIIPIYLDGRKIAEYTASIGNKIAFETNKGGAY